MFLPNFRMVVLFGCFLATLVALPAKADNTLVGTPAGLYFPQLETVAGNPNGKVSIVEFFDYNCKYCRKVPPFLAKIIKNNPQVRIVYRDYPLLGLSSEYAAQAAVAAQLQKKYLPLHAALLNATQPLDDAFTLKTARAQGVDVEKLQSDMTTPAVSAQLKQNETYADMLGINGIPTFIVAATPSSASSGTTSAYLLVSPEEQSLNELIKKVK